MRFFFAIRVFFLTLFSSSAAAQIGTLLQQRGLPAPEPQEEQPVRPAPVVREKPQKPIRSEALTLLATLQREARLIDLVQESLDNYTDEQVGAAARDVLRSSRAVLDRLFDLQPVVRETEGAPVELPTGFDTGRYRLTGNVSGPPPFRGSLMHHGWEAGKCEVPAWSGNADAARVVASAEVELRGV
ncbi:MAG: DUF2760 domain-containing protein [Planctomycetota bacterium]|nr:DUF2760 domain-containing protein [Planctomycetota bacterium]